MQSTENDFPATVHMWVRAVARAFHPARWGLCLLALSVSLLVGALTLIVFEADAWQPGAWWNDPREAIIDGGGQLFGKSSGTAVFRSFVLLFALSFIWSLVAGWIARSEFLRRRASQETFENPERSQVTASAFVRSKARTLWFLLPFILFVAALFCLPGLMAGLVNRIFPLGIGATLIALALPLLLMCSLLVLVILVGGLSYCIMPVALAAEGSDSFDAIARSYSYLLQRPFRFAWYSGWCLVISSMPTLAMLALLDAQPPLVGPAGKWLVAAGAAALSLSLFWTLQTFTYLKLRRLIDNTPEDEIWDGISEVNSPKASSSQNATTPDNRQSSVSVLTQSGSLSSLLRPGEEGRKIGQSQPGPGLEPRRDPFSFADTWRLVRGFHPRKVVWLFGGVVWTGLVLAGGILTVHWLTAAPRAALTLERLREAVLGLAEQQPLALLGIAAGMVLLGALGLGGLSKMVARMAATDVMFGVPFAPFALRAFVHRTRTQGIGSVVLFTLGTELFLATSFLLALVVQKKSSLQEVLVLGSFAGVFLTLGAFGLGAVAVEGEKQKEASLGTIAVFLLNLAETLASAVMNAVIGLVKFVLVVGLAWLGWLVTCETISWSGGAHVRWLRWGLDGTLVPGSEDGLYQAAWAITGCWFFLLFAFAWIYAFSYTLSWGVVGYLRARQKNEEHPSRPFEPTAEERAWFDAEQQKRQEQQRLEEEKNQKKEASRLAEEKESQAPNM